MRAQTGATKASGAKSYTTTGFNFWCRPCTASVTSGTNNLNGNVYVHRTPEQFTYDLDGNLKTDGRWNYTWDAENRLVQMTANTSVGPNYQLSFAYDFKGRRIQKSTALYNGSAYVNQSTVNFLYDGWNLLATLSASLAPVDIFMWGNDVSGSLQGAGGVGGLLLVNYSGSSYFPAFDGNGNVAALVNAANGVISANYEYGPFGEVIRQTGPIAKANPMRFSTKYQDDESDLLYYGYRYYRASTGTWLSRDPIAEFGFLFNNGFLQHVFAGQNVYEFLWTSSIYDFSDNDPISGYDLWGLANGTHPKPPRPPTPQCTDGDSKNAVGDIPDSYRHNCSSTNFKGSFGITGSIKVSVGFGAATSPWSFGLEVQVTIAQSYEFDIPCGREQWLQASVPCNCQKGQWVAQPAQASVGRMERAYKCPPGSSCCSK